MYSPRLSRRVLFGAVVLASALGDIATAADTRAVGCGTSRVGEITVATLSNAPIVTLVANGDCPLIPAATLAALTDIGAAGHLGVRLVSNRLGNIAARVCNAQHCRTPGNSHPETWYFKA